MGGSAPKVPSPDPVAAVQLLLDQARAVADPQARAALFAGAQAALAGLAAPPPALPRILGPAERRRASGA